MNIYPEGTTQPTIILPSLSEQIWEKFEYFDKKTEENPNDYQYADIRDELLGLWFKRFKKEYKYQAPIFKKEGKK